MALDASFGPWAAAAEAKERNRKTMMDSIQGIGQSFGTVGQIIKDKQWQKTIDLAMAQETDPNKKQFLSMMKMDPTLADKFPAMMKQSSPWRVVSGMLSPDGQPVQQNEATGEVRSVPLKVTPTGRGNSAFGVGSVTWDNASEEDKHLAKALYEGNVQASHLGTRDRSFATKLAVEYAIRNGLPAFQSYSGDVHAGTAKGFASGKQGQSVLSLNTALGHVQSAMDAYDAVGNMDVRLLNSPLNKVKEETSDPNIIKLQTTLVALSGELATVFKGTGGTDQEIAKWMHVLSQDLTPKQAVGVVQQVGDLLNSRLDALNQMRETGMGKPAGSPLLSPHAKTISEAISKRGKATLGGKKTTTFASVEAAEAAGLPPGTKVTIGGRSATIQ